MVKRVVVGAHYGLKDWLGQRVTAAVMAIYTLLLVVVLLSHPGLNYPEWKSLVASQWMRVATVLFFFCLYYHAWIGVRDILMDYVHPAGARLMAQIVVVLALVLYAIWTVQILWS